MADLAEEAQKYGWNLSVFKSNKELYAILKKAIKESWSQARFTAAIQGSKWYRSRSESQRLGIALKSSDPKEYARQVQKMSQHIRSMYGEMAGGQKMSSKWLASMANQAVMMGMTDEELRRAIGQDIGFKTLMSKDVLGGEAGALEEQMDQWGRQYGVRLSDSWKASRLKEAMMGNSDRTAILQTIQKIAKSRYRAFADDIDAGATIEDIAEGYKSSMAKILEINPGEIDVFDKNIQKALTYTDPEKGKPDPKPIWKFEEELRYDPRWTKTDNAREDLLGAGHEILKLMGVTV